MNHYETTKLVLVAALLPLLAFWHFMVFRVNQRLPEERRIPHFSPFKRVSTSCGVQKAVSPKLLVSNIRHGYVRVDALCPRLDRISWVGIPYSKMNGPNHHLAEILNFT